MSEHPKKIGTENFSPEPEKNYQLTEPGELTKTSLHPELKAIGVKPINHEEAATVAQSAIDKTLELQSLPELNITEIEQLKNADPNTAKGGLLIYLKRQFERRRAQNLTNQQHAA